MFLYGKEFQLITDHKPLEVIFGTKSKPCARIERWVLRLQFYKYAIRYSPGKNNIADPLSRLCKLAQNPRAIYEDYVHNVIEYIRPAAIPMQEIVEHSQQDEEIKKVKNGLYNNNWDETVITYKIFQTELCFYGDVLLRGTKSVIPIKLR